MALGAVPLDVLKQVLSSTGRLVGIALLVGVGLSVIAGRALASKMQGMGSADLWLFIFVPTVMITTTLAASFMPARSATRVEPVLALRHD
jgi:ABC-type antimicrobial peptide transport system permease subunit